VIGLSVLLIIPPTAVGHYNREVSTVATSVQIPLDAHRDRCPKNIHFHETPRGELLATRVDESMHPHIYCVTGTTRNPRALVIADAVVIDGQRENTFEGP